MNQTNIALLTDSLVVGGSERQLIRLAKFLFSNCGLGITIIDFGRKSTGTFTPPQHVKYFNLVRFFRYDPLPALKLLRLMKEEKLEILHCFGLLAATYSIFASRLVNIKVVHNVIRGIGENNIKRDFLKKYTAMMSDIVVSNSGAGLRYFKFCKGPKYRVIYNGIDPKETRIERNRAEIRARFDLERFDPLITFIGGLKSSRDHETLIRATPMVLNQYPNCGFAIVGDGPKRKKLERMASNVGRKDSIKFLGYQNDAKEILYASDLSLLLSPKETFEGISNVILESMVAGVPVITTKSGASPEYIIHGKNGMLLQPEDEIDLSSKISDLLENHELRSKLIIEGRRTIRKLFLMEKIANQWITLYSHLLK